MAMKKMLGRFVIGIMQSSGLVLAASILLGVFEFLQITSLAARDKVCLLKDLMDRQRHRCRTLVATYCSRTTSDAHGSC
jgi:hypothetical protein